MAETIADAKKAFEHEGLFVSCQSTESLLIASKIQHLNGKLTIADNACVLRFDGKGWIIILPDVGIQTQEIRTSYSDAVQFITNLYHLLQTTTSHFNDVVHQAVLARNQNDANRFSVSA